MLGTSNHVPGRPLEFNESSVLTFLFFGLHFCAFHEYYGHGSDHWPVALHMLHHLLDPPVAISEASEIIFLSMFFVFRLSSVYTFWSEQLF